MDTFASMITVLVPDEDEEEEPSDMEQTEGGPRVRSRSPRTRKARQLKDLKKQWGKMQAIVGEFPAWDCLKDEGETEKSKFEDAEAAKGCEAKITQYLNSPEAKAEVERRIKEQVYLRLGAQAWGEPLGPPPAAIPTPPPALMLQGCTPTLGA